MPAPYPFHRIGIIESPYAGDVERNLRYVRAAMRHCLLNGTVPFASHALYTQPGVLDDQNPAERELGIRAGFFLGEALFRGGRIIERYDDQGLSVRTVPVRRMIFSDLGDSGGMRLGVDHANDIGMQIDRIVLGWKDKG